MLINLYTTLFMILLLCSNILDVYTMEPMPLHIAASMGKIETIKTLLDADADINSTHNEYGNTALHIAAWFGHHDCVRLLISRGARLDIVNKYGSTPVHSAAWKNEIECLKILLENGASFTQANTTGIGNTPLYLAAKAGSTECLRILLTYIGSDKKEIDKECAGNKNTALQIAAAYEQVQCYWDLVVAGADYTKKVFYNKKLLSNSQMVLGNHSFEIFLKKIEGKIFIPYFISEYYYCFLCLKDFHDNNVIVTTQPCKQTFHWDCFKDYSINYHIQQNKHNPHFMRHKKDMSDKEFAHSMKVNIIGQIPLADQCPECKNSINTDICSLSIFRK